MVEGLGRKGRGKLKIMATNVDRSKINIDRAEDESVQSQLANAFPTKFLMLYLTNESVKINKCGRVPWGTKRARRWRVATLLAIFSQDWRSRWSGDWLIKYIITGSFVLGYFIIH